MMLRSIASRSTDDLWPHVEPSRGAGRLPIWRRIGSGLRAYSAARAEQRRLRQAEGELQCLDDRMLKDIGIGRSEIGRIVRYGRGI